MNSTNHYLKINHKVFRFSGERLAAYRHSVLAQNGPSPEDYGEELYVPDLSLMGDAEVRALLDRVKLP